jgi:2-C-methyl-D-erythritol 4-phosphate cytidylyltransferase
MSTGAILLCAGRGERLGLGVPKALVSLAGRPLFARVLETLERSSAIDSIVVVGPVRALREALAASGFAPAKVAAWAEGGRERQHSVARGLAALPPACDLVVVHDAARALLSAALLARVVADARAHGASIAALPLEDTLKRATLEVIDDTVPRAGLWRAQTPQAFRRDWLEEAHRVAVESKAPPATDDASMVEAIGSRVRLTRGEAINFKITTPEDLRLAEAALLGRAEHERT